MRGIWRTDTLIHEVDAHQGWQDAARGRQSRHRGLDICTTWGALTRGRLGTDKRVLRHRQEGA